MKYRMIALEPAMLLLSIILTSGAWGQELDPDAILGTWSIEKDGEPVQHIEIFRCVDHYCGRIVWLQDPETDGRPKLDEKNKDESLRKRPLLGLTVLSGYSHERGNVWSGGELYAVEKGRVVSPKLRLIDENQLEVRIRILMFKKTFIWKRLFPER